MKKKVTAMVLAASMLFGAMGAVASADASQVSVENYSYSQSTMESLNYLNTLRAKLGLRELKIDPFLTKAAENHAKYLSSNKAVGHEESSSKSGYTGTTPKERVTAVGGSGDAVKGLQEVVATRFTSAKQGIDAFVNAPLHRASIFDSQSVYAGVSYVGDSLVILLSGYQTPDVVGVYPYDGQTNVDTVFLGNERPNPLEKFGISQSGYVISFQTPYIIDYSDGSTSFKVTNSKGADVPYFISRESNGTILLYPKKELDKGEKYTVVANFSPLTGAEAGKKMNKTWSFTTAGVGSTNPTPNLPSNPVVTPPTTGQPTKYTKDNIGIKLNGTFISVIPKPVIKSGTTFIPLRGVFEKMGATVTWNQQKKQVTVVKDNKKIILTIGSTGAYVNGEAVKLTSEPYVTPEGSTYVPLRFISETIGAQVVWDQTNYLVNITE